MDNLKRLVALVLLIPPGVKSITYDYNGTTYTVFKAKYHHHTPANDDGQHSHAGELYRRLPYIKNFTANLKMTGSLSAVLTHANGETEDLGGL